MTKRLHENLENKAHITPNLEENDSNQLADVADSRSRRPMGTEIQCTPESWSTRIRHVAEDSKELRSSRQFLQLLLREEEISSLLNQLRGDRI